jgi:hypothetical protein
MTKILFAFVLTVAAFYPSLAFSQGQGMLYYRPYGLTYSNAVREKTVAAACDPVIVRPNSAANEEQARLTELMSSFLGPTPVPPGMATPPPSVEDLDVAKGIFDRWSDLSCVMSDEKPRIQMMEEAVIESFGFGPMKEVRPIPENVAQRQIEAIRQRYPGSPFAVLVEAYYLNAVAWDARGGGFNYSVTPEGRKIFDENIEKEIALLQANKAAAANNPDYYHALIAAIGSSEGYSPQLVQAFKEGAARYKFYSQIYFQTLAYTDQKWGGSPEAMDELIRWSTDNTRREIGDWMYARLYGYVAVYLSPEESIFSNTKASWPLIRKGYTDHLDQASRPDHYMYGVSSDVQFNLLVRFSCEAADKKTFLTYRPRIDGHVLTGDWQGPLSLPVCDEKFKYRTPKA